MQVGDVIVDLAVVLQRIRVSVGIIGEIQEVTAIAFPQQLATGIEIIVGALAGDGFLGAQAVGIVFKGNRAACTACSSKISAILPGEVPVRAVVVTQRVAGCVIGDALSIKCRQQILPVGISISIGMAISTWESSTCPR